LTAHRSTYRLRHDSEDFLKKLPAALIIPAFMLTLAAGAALAGPATGNVPRPLKPVLPARDIGTKWPGVPVLLDQYGTYRTR
jgi:hypothetical protein